MIERPRASKRADGPRFFGRRVGRRPRPGRRQLLATLLPGLRLAIAGGDTPRDLRALFDADLDDVWLEVGFGAGEHLAALACAHPRIGFVGCEPYVSGVGSLLARIRDKELGNVRIFDDDARLLLPLIADANVQRVMVLFPDPWPKHRHRERRFISAGTVDALARILKDGGELLLATDHTDYVRWTLGHLADHPAFIWTAEGASDWRDRPEGWLPTRYEQKALVRGERCTYLRFRRRRRGGD